MAGRQEGGSDLVQGPIPTGGPSEGQNLQENVVESAVDMLEEKAGPSVPRGPLRTRSRYAIRSECILERSRGTAVIRRSVRRCGPSKSPKSSPYTRVPRSGISDLDLSFLHDMDPVAQAELVKQQEEHVEVLRQRLEDCRRRYNATWSDRREGQKSELTAAKEAYTEGLEGLQTWRARLAQFRARFTVTSVEYSDSPNPEAMEAMEVSQDGDRRAEQLDFGAGGEATPPDDVSESPGSGVDPCCSMEKSGTVMAVVEIPEAEEGGAAAMEVAEIPVETGGVMADPVAPDAAGGGFPALDVAGTKDLAAGPAPGEEEAELPVSAVMAGAGALPIVPLEPRLRRGRAVVGASVAGGQVAGSLLQGGRPELLQEAGGGSEAGRGGAGSREGVVVVEGESPLVSSLEQGGREGRSSVSPEGGVVGVTPGQLILEGGGGGGALDQHDVVLLKDGGGGVTPDIPGQQHVVASGVCLGGSMEVSGRQALGGVPGVVPAGRPGGVATPPGARLVAAPGPPSGARRLVLPPGGVVRPAGGAVSTCGSGGVEEGRAPPAVSVSGTPSLPPSYARVAAGGAPGVGPSGPSRGPSRDVPPAPPGYARRNVAQLRWMMAGQPPARKSFVKSLVAAGILPKDVFALISPWGGGDYEVSFMRPEGLDTFCERWEADLKHLPEWQGFLLKRLSSQPLNKKVIIATRNESIPSHDLITWLHRHADIMGPMTKVPGEGGFWAADWVVPVRLRVVGGVVQHIPSSAFLGRDRLSIFYPGQPKVCFRCGARDHFAATCKWIKCSLCQGLGHAAKDCKSIRCNLCGVIGHAYSQCPEALHNLQSLADELQRQDGEDAEVEDCVRVLEADRPVLDSCPPVSVVPSVVAPSNVENPVVSSLVNVPVSVLSCPVPMPRGTPVVAVMVQGAEAPPKGVERGKPRLSGALQPAPQEEQELCPLSSGEDVLSPPEVSASEEGMEVVRRRRRRKRKSVGGEEEVRVAPLALPSPSVLQLSNRFVFGSGEVLSEDEGDPLVSRKVVPSSGGGWG